MSNKRVVLQPTSVGEVVAYLRKEKHLTLAQVAERTGKSVSYLSDIERGRTKPTLDTLTAISKAVGHEFHVIFSEDGDHLFPCSTLEVELIMAARAKDYAVCLAMLLSITGWAQEHATRDDAQGETASGGGAK